MNKKGVVFFDIDRTLIDWQKGINDPTESTRESINRLKANGYLTMLATGRPRNLITQNLINLELDGIVGSNGAYIEIDGKVIFNEYIDNEKLKELIEFLEEHDMEYMLEGEEINYIKDRTNSMIVKLLEDAGFKEENICLDWDINEVKVPKIIVLTQERENYLKAYEKFSKLGFAFMDNEGGMFEIYDERYNKGYGVKKLLEMLNISKEDSYAFGDGENDLEMFQEVKHGIAMGGYFEKLGEYAFDFTEDVQNEGITKGLEKLGLI